MMTVEFAFGSGRAVVSTGRRPLCEAKSLEWRPLTAAILKQRNFRLIAIAAAKGLAALPLDLERKRGVFRLWRSPRRQAGAS